MESWMKTRRLVVHLNKKPRTKWSHNDVEKDYTREPSADQIRDHIFSPLRFHMTITTDTLDHGPGRFAGPVIFQAAFVFGVWKYFFRTLPSGQSIDRGQTKSASTRLISPYLFAHFTCSTADGFGHIILTHQTQRPPGKPSRPTIKCIRGTGCEFRWSLHMWNILKPWNLR